VLTDLIEARHPIGRPAFPAADGRHALTPVQFEHLHTATATAA